MKLDHLVSRTGRRLRLVAGSCSVTKPMPRLPKMAPAINPIAVEPSYRDLKLQFAGGADGMSADDAGKFDAFVATIASMATAC
jgi:hypothetical protein